VAKSLQAKKVLVLGEDTRSFLSVIRSLGEGGMHVDVVTLDNLSPSIRSKWVKQVFNLNYQAFSQEQWSQKVEQILETGSYDLVVPCDERSIYPLLDIKERFTGKTVFAIPERSVLAPLFDKKETRKLAASLNIPVAQGELINLTSLDNKALIEKYGIPLVLKPAMSYESDQLDKRNSVVIAKNEQDINKFRTLHSHSLVEQYFSGVGMGLSVLASKGKVRAAFAHKRVSEPEKGGGSSYRKAVPLDIGMLDACQKICSHLDYTGVAMFEFKHNEQKNAWILIEVNARFWGSLPLAIFAGVNFPILMANYLLTQQRPNKLTYNHRARARNLTADFYDMKISFDSLRTTSGLFTALKKTIVRLLSMFYLLTGNETIDSFKWNDKAPFYEELKLLFKDKIAKLTRFDKKRALTDKGLSNLPSTPVKKILVLCYGNIMRSPFATDLLREKLKEKGLETTVEGAGFHNKAGRPAPKRCITTASLWNIDLSEHRSKKFTQSMILQREQLIVYFDLKHELLLKSYYSNYSALNLAHFVPPPKGPLEEIIDPYDGTDESLISCYKNIDAGLDNLLEQLEQRRIIN
jgi:protein-tyrosine-phosphatase